MKGERIGGELRRQEAWPIKFQTDMLNGNNVPQVSSKMLKRDGISKILLPNIGLSIPQACRRSGQYASVKGDGIS